MIERSCEICGKPFLAWPKDVKRGHSKFCSRTCLKVYKTVPIEQRLLSNLSDPTETGCVLWLGKKDPKGYGLIGVSCKSGHFHAAHRVAWEIANGPIPEGGCILHHCDNPPCCNHEHLFLGDRAINAADKVSKDRQLRGETHNIAKLTEDNVREIRARYAAGGITQDQLGDDYGVTASNVNQIVNRRTWTHI